MGRPLFVERWRHTVDDKKRGGSRRPDQPNRRGPGDRSHGYRADGPGEEQDRVRPARGVLRVGDSPASELPRWVRDEIRLATAKDRVQPTMTLLQEAAYGFAAGKYRQVIPKLEEAKSLSSRVATIRELLGLSYYRSGQWESALKEMRAFRRLAGETTHMAVELDALRALDRPDDVEKTWRLFRELGGDTWAKSEAKVVYSSFLLERGRAREAWRIIKPERLVVEAPEHSLREWYVAARVAGALGDTETALKLAKTIEKRDVSFPGLEELFAEIG